jgi:pilus assembly protein CpaE
MKATMSAKTAAIFGPPDNELLRQLETAGLRAACVPIKNLATFATTHKVVDVAIIDVRDSKQIPEELAVLKRRHPLTALVLLTRSLDPSLMLDAIRSGINECLTEPVTAEALEAALVRLTAQHGPSVDGDLFAFLGAKGGVGTTTVAVNVATAFAQAGESTLFIDLHIAYGDAAVFFGAEPKFSVVDALENIHRLDAALFKTLVVPTSSSVDLLASSSQGLVWATDVQRVRRLLEFSQQHYRYVVVDCPRSDGTVLDALESATKVILVANQELAALRSGSRMAAMLRQRYRPERVQVIATRFDRASEIGHADVERVIGASVRHLVPSDYKSSLDALNRGRPLVLKNHSLLASSLDTLARDLAGINVARPVAAKNGASLIGRLTGRR